MAWLRLSSSRDPTVAVMPKWRVGLECERELMACGLTGPQKPHKQLQIKDGARCRFRTCDPYRVKVMLYR
jgi:hypothetical protein